jgi:hypothetical protein
LAFGYGGRLEQSKEKEENEPAYEREAASDLQDHINEK